jgi:dTDP-4-amino-4,6-dideoxygalactose transaminase
MPVHVFSNSCDIEKIEAIANKHNLKVIYDAAHAFGVEYKGRSVMSYGDISCTSFHATKLFNTGEGGACFSQNKNLISKLKQLRFFGHNEEKDIVSDGCNGKMTELHAAMGLANIKYYETVLERRKKVFDLYYQGLSSTKRIKFQKVNSNSYNYGYMPVIFESEKVALGIEKELNKNKVYPRRYFYPSLDTLDYFGKPNNCPISEDISKKILCLPSHNWITDEQINYVINIVTMEIK